jgi:hypothetical protein
MPLGSDLQKKLLAMFGDATQAGIFPLVAYTVESDAHHGVTRIGAVTTNIRIFPYSVRLLERTGTRYNLAQPIPLSTARRLVEGYPDIFRWMEMKLDLLQPADFAHLEMIVKCVSPTFWVERAFALVDICEFSKLAPYYQSAQLLSLDHIVRTATQRCQYFCRELGISSTFARANTGDGYYLWHAEVGGTCDTAVFLLLLCVMASAEAIRAEHNFPLRLRGAYAVGSTFTFYDRSLDVTGADVFREDVWDRRELAVGPVTNALARMIAQARPRQILVGEFSRTEQAVRPRDPHDLMEQAQELFERERREIITGPATVGELRFDPLIDPPLNIVGKHGEILSYCNLVGTILTRFSAGNVTLQQIGVPYERIMEMRMRKLVGL